MVVFASTIARDITSRTVVEKKFVFMEDRRNNVRSVEGHRSANTKDRRTIVKTVFIRLLTLSFSRK